MIILELIFWVGTLLGWCVVVGYATKVMEGVLDTLLDRWFEPNEDIE